MGISIEIWGIILAALGVALTIYFGVKSRNRRRQDVSQKQTTEKGGLSIQSGRDTKIK